MRPFDFAIYILVAIIADAASFLIVAAMREASEKRHSRKRKQ